MTIFISNIKCLAIKHHISFIQSTHNKTEFKERELDRSILYASTRYSSPNPSAQQSCHSNNDESQNEAYDQDYLYLNDLAIGMNRQPIKNILHNLTSIFKNLLEVKTLFLSFFLLNYFVK